MRAGETPSLSRVARALHLSARTLQRQLAQEELSFESVLEAERAALARHHLAEGRLSLEELAFLLGYSEPRALARAFKRWTGTTPSAFRARSQPQR
jgi:AraC-like DNA-binding protein